MTPIPKTREFDPHIRPLNHDRLDISVAHLVIVICEKPPSASSIGRAEKSTKVIQVRFVAIVSSDEFLIVVPCNSFEVHDVPHCAFGLRVGDVVLHNLVDSHWAVFVPWFAQKRLEGREGHIRPLQGVCKAVLLWCNF